MTFRTAAWVVCDGIDEDGQPCDAQHPLHLRAETKEDAFKEARLEGFVSRKRDGKTIHLCEDCASLEKQTKGNRP